MHSQTRRTDAIDETVAWIWSDILCSSCCLFLGTGQTVLDTIDAHELKTSGIHSRHRGQHMHAFESGQDEHSGENRGRLRWRRGI
jgi:hypothetical protein